MACRAAGRFAPPPPPPLAPGAGGVIVAGIALCLVSVILLALGVAVQKYALTFINPSRRLSDLSGWCRRLPACATRAHAANAVWLAGLVTYFLGNGVFVVALAYTPASLAAALMATIVVVNALFSRCMLRETLKRCDYHGGALIMAGIAVTAWYAPSEVVSYDAPSVVALFSPTQNFSGFAYFLLLFFCTLALASLVLFHEASLRRTASSASPAEPASPAFGPESPASAQRQRQRSIQSIEAEGLAADFELAGAGHACGAPGGGALGGSCALGSDPGVVTAWASGGAGDGAAGTCELGSRGGGGAGRGGRKPGRSPAEHSPRAALCAPAAGIEKRTKVRVYISIYLTSYAYLSKSISTYVYWYIFAYIYVCIFMYLYLLIYTYICINMHI